MKGALDRAAVRQAVALAVLLGLWEISARLGLLNAMFFPPPSRIWIALVALFTEGWR